MKIFRTLGASVVAGLVAGAAQAQWLHQETGGAFDDNPMQLAATAIGGGAYGLGLRCTSPDDLVVLFITPERIEGGLAEIMTSMSPDLLIRVDDNDPVEVKPSIEGQDGDDLSAIAEIDVALVDEINAATRRVSVAIRLAGDLYHETEFNVRGSTAATATLMEKCGLN